jgi:hypothetical protein
VKKLSGLFVCPLKKLTDDDDDDDDAWKREKLVVSSSTQWAFVCLVQEMMMM